MSRSLVRASHRFSPWSRQARPTTTGSTDDDGLDRRRRARPTTTGSTDDDRLDRRRQARPSTTG
jgi:hypothetical protein